MNKRNECIDIIKGILIILVVLGHCIQYGNGIDFINNQKFFENIAFKVIYSFHMPCFMLISGYLFYYSVKKYSTKEIILNKCKKYIIPIISFTIIISLLNLIFGNININEIFYNIKYYSVLLWFFWAVFGYSILISLVNRFFKDNIYIYILIFIGTFFIPFLNTITFMYPYFVIGYLSNKYNYVEKYKKISCSSKYIIISLLIGIFTLLMKYYNYDAYIYTSGIYILNKNMKIQLIIDAYRYIIGTIGSLCFVGFIELIYKKININIKNIIIELGKETFGIYALSASSMYIIFPLLIKNIIGINYFAVIGETIITILVCMFLIKIIKRIKPLNYLILGNIEKNK